MTSPIVARQYGGGFCNRLVLSVALLALPGAPGHAADNVTLRNVTFQIDQTTYRLAQIEFVGVNQSQQQLSALFDPGAPEPLAARLAILSADAVNIPELIAEWSAPEGRQTVTLRGLSLTNVAAGRAARASADAARGEGTFLALVNTGPVAITDLDLALAARLYGQGPAAMSKDSDAVVGALDLNGIDVRTKNGSGVHADRLSLSGVRALPTGTQDADARPSASNAQRYLSGVGTVSFAGVRADIISGEAIDERLKVSIRSASLATEHPYNGLPTDIALAIDDLKLLIPSSSQSGRDLLGVGYDTIDASLRMSASWNEAMSEVVSDIALRVRDAGSIALRATLGNVTKEAFSSTPAVAEAASNKVTVKALAASLNDAGLLDRLITNEARKQKRSADEIRSDLLFESGTAIVSMLGTSRDGAALSKAVTDFIRKPGQLEIAVKTRPPEGLAWTDLVAAAAAPAEIADKLAITARAR
jgi:hypothetical protein